MRFLRCLSCLTLRKHQGYGASRQQYTASLILATKLRKKCLSVLNTEHLCLQISQDTRSTHRTVRSISHPCLAGPCWRARPCSLYRLRLASTPLPPAFSRSPRYGHTAPLMLAQLPLSFLGGALRHDPQPARPPQVAEGMEQETSTKSGGEPNPLDTTGLCLLSLGGGGVRGLSMLYILKSTIDRLNYERKEGLPPTKPCEVFDLIGGTSIGG